MTSRTFLRGLPLLAGGWIFASPVHAEVADEKGKIEALISHVENLKDAKFIRNGSNYDAKSAAKFLRGKWQSKDKEIRTAAEFIEKVATVSSTTGKPYLIRFSDGREVKCGEYLKGELKK
ncbi:MAG: DUF5329 family protein [Verrucomicrobia bacterium]|nr:DUF5329 family protein [Verrucomicrobiota bacterium]